MNISQIESRAAKLVSWAPVFKKFRASGLSQRKFCLQEKLDLSTFRKWLHLNTQRALFEAQEKASFVPVQLGYEVDVATAQELEQRNQLGLVSLKQSNTFLPVQPEIAGEAGTADSPTELVVELPMGVTLRFRMGRK